MQRRLLTVSTCADATAECTRTASRGFDSFRCSCISTAPYKENFPTHHARALHYRTARLSGVPSAVGLSHYSIVHYSPATKVMGEEYAISLFYPLYEGSVNEVLLLLFLFVTNVKTHFIELYRIFCVGEPTVNMFSILKCVCLWSN